VVRAPATTGYRGLTAVELPRHAHAAPRVARASLTFLADALAAARATGADAPASEQIEKEVPR
jgi:L-ribulose-5-phosphate 3-epimerase